MAENDIRPFTAGLGGHDRIQHFRMGALTTSATADTSWKRGEVLLLAVATGDIDAAADGAINLTANLHYLAAAGSAELLRFHGGVSAAPTHDIMVPVYPFNTPNMEFICRTLYTATDVPLVMATVAQVTIFIGDTVGLWRDDAGLITEATLINGDFGVNTGGTGLSITRFIDANGVDINDANAGAAVAVVVKRDTSV